MVHAYIAFTKETEVGGSWDQGKPGLYSESLPQNKKKSKRKKEKTGAETGKHL
jgi:hypothetical protein